MLVPCRRRWPNLKQNLVKMKIEPTGRSASKITDVRNPPVLSVKDSLHCIQTTRVICYIRPRPNCLAIHDMMSFNDTHPTFAGSDAIPTTMLV